MICIREISEISVRFIYIEHESLEWHELFVFVGFVRSVFVFFLFDGDLADGIAGEVAAEFFQNLAIYLTQHHGTVNLTST